MLIILLQVLIISNIAPLGLCNTLYPFSFDEQPNAAAIHLFAFAGKLLPLRWQGNAPCAFPLLLAPCSSRLLLHPK